MRSLASDPLNALVCVTFFFGGGLVTQNCMADGQGLPFETRAQCIQRWVLPLATLREFEGLPVVEGQGLFLRPRQSNEGLKRSSR